MISAHCGQRLRQSLPHAIGSKVGWHEWTCDICRRVFKQRIRRPVVKGSK